MQIDFPFHPDNRGRSGATDGDGHVRDLIEQVLFTTPGERVNRPDFGSGLLQLVFALNSPELAATAQFLVQGALQQWLGDVIAVDAVEVQADDGRVTVEVRYLVRRTQERQVARFDRAT